MITFQEFEAEATAQGCDEVFERAWPPHHSTPPHVHEFSVQGLVTAGDMFLTLGGEERHLRAGDRFEVAAGVRHAERYGEQGARYWAARSR